MNALDQIEIALWVATAAQTAFVVIYGLRAPWRSGFVGRALFVKSAVLWVVLAITIVNQHFIYPHQLEVAAVLMWLLAFAVVYQLAALIERMWLDKRERVNR